MDHGLLQVLITKEDVYNTVKNTHAKLRFLYSNTVIHLFSLDKTLSTAIFAYKRYHSMPLM